MAHAAFISGCEGLRLTQDEARFFNEAQPWGFILFARNIEDPEQLRRLTGDLRGSVGWDAPILIDQEGGRVQRMTPPHWRQYLPPLDQAARAGKDAARVFYLRYLLISAELRDVGINVNCVPCADLARPETHAILRNRCYGDSVADIVEIARAVANGCLDGGVLPIAKHLPGYGLASVDSHLDLPKVDIDPETLNQNDFTIFRDLADLPMGMTAHIVFEQLSDAPATTDPTMIKLIRQDIGFKGLLMSDDISMEALSGDVVTRSKATLAAGCDLVLHCNGKLEEMQAIAEHCGSMSDEAEMRAEAALKLRHPPEAIDIAAIEAEFEALSG